MFTGNRNKIGRWLEKEDTYRKKKHNPLRNRTPWYRTKMDMKKAV